MEIQSIVSRKNLNLIKFLLGNRIKKEKQIKIMQLIDSSEIEKRRLVYKIMKLEVFFLKG